VGGEAVVRCCGCVMLYVCYLYMLFESYPVLYVCCILLSRPAYEPLAEPSEISNVIATLIVYRYPQPSCCFCYTFSFHLQEQVDRSKLGMDYDNLLNSFKVPAWSEAQERVRCGC
jgi:hypothetical protein